LDHETSEVLETSGVHTKHVRNGVETLRVPTFEQNQEILQSTLTTFACTRLRKFLCFNQDMFRIRLRPYLFAVSLGLILASACSPQPATTPFRPPTKPAPTQILSTTTPIPALYTITPTSTVTSTPTAVPCENNFEFIEDLTIPDGTTISTGVTVDKQWLVKNSGTCNWDSTYRLKWIGGDPLGAAQEQILYPARAGAQTILRITFTAPTAEGTYESSWRAYSKDGDAFGDPVFMKIVVIP
jgi:hypothetical protein